MSALRPLLRLLIKAGVSAGLLTAVFLFVPIRPVLEGLRGVSVGYALTGLAFASVTMYLVAVRIRIFARRHQLSLTIGQIFRIGYVTQFYALVLPGIIAGGAIRWYQFSRYDGKPLEALMTIVLGRLSSLLFAVGLGLAAWSFDPLARRNAALGVGLAVVLVAIACVHWILLHRPTALKTAQLIVSWRRVPESWKRTATRVLESAGDSRGLGMPLAAIALLGLLEQLFAIASDVLFARAVGVDVATVSIGWIRSYQLLIALLPITIGGFGVREGAMIVLLASYGVSAEAAVTYSLLLFGRRLFAGLIGAGLELLSLVRPGRLRPREAVSAPDER